MSIAFNCASCGKKYSVKDEFAGKRVKCAACGATMVLPAVDAKPSLPPAQTAAPNTVSPKQPANPPGSIFDELELEESSGGARGKSTPVMAGHVLQPRIDPSDIDDFELEPPAKVKIDVGVFMDDEPGGSPPAGGKTGVAKKNSAKSPPKSPAPFDEAGFDLSVAEDAHEPAPPPEPTVPCPGCGEPMKQSAVLCINCGLNVRTGERIEGAKKGGFGKLFGGLRREK